MDKLFEMVQMISGIPPAKQKLVLGQTVLPQTGTIAAAGISDGDLIQVHPNANPFEQAPDGSAVDPDAFLAAIRQNPDIMQRVSAQNKSLESAIASGDTSQMQASLRQVGTPHLSALQELQCAILNASIMCQCLTCCCGAACNNTSPGEASPAGSTNASGGPT